MKLNKSGQIGIEEVGLIGAVIIFLVVILPLFVSLINSVSTGNIDGVVNLFIPLIILALFVELMRRIFS